jgi:hypothetical protein
MQKARLLSSLLMIAGLKHTVTVSRLLDVSSLSAVRGSRMRQARISAASPHRVFGNCAPVIQGNEIPRVGPSRSIFERYRQGSVIHAVWGWIISQTFCPSPAWLGKTSLILNHPDFFDSAKKERPYVTGMPGSIKANTARQVCE